MTAIYNDTHFENVCWSYVKGISNKLLNKMQEVKWPF